MIKRTPQEIADFFGGYVARDNDLRWHVFRDKPEKKLAYWRINNVKCGTYLNTEFIDTNLCDKRVCLYEPRLDNKSEINYQNQPEVDNKAPHQSEVHVEKEYVLLGEFQPGTLMYKVNELLKDGFRLYGNPWTGPDSIYGYIHYQAMVRGV